MDIRVLRYVEAIARLGSFTKSSKELRIAQPALSIAVKGLEDELGVVLFVRHPRSVVATPEGQALLKRAKRIFHEFDAARRDMEAAADLKTGEVKVGLPPMYGLAYFPELISSFHRKHPGISVTAIVGSAGEGRQLIEDGAIDLGMLERRRIPDDWKRVEVGRDETVLCVPLAHPLAKRRGRKIAAKDLDGLEMVMFDPSFLQRQVLDARCAAADVEPKIVVQSNFVPLIIRAVGDGLGSTTLMRSIAAKDDRIVPLSFDPPEIFRFFLCWREDHLLSRAARAFIEHARKRYEAGDTIETRNAPSGLRPTGR